MEYPVINLKFGYRIYHEKGEKDDDKGSYSGWSD